MDNRQFVEGYQQPENHFRFTDDTPEVTELMEGPRKWASFFNRQLSLYLKGAPGNPPADVYKQLDSYKHDWLEQHLDATIEESRELTFHDISAEQGVGELNFHILNNEFIPLWRRVLLPELQSPLGSDQLEAMQIRLAVRASKLAMTRKKTLDKEAVNGLHTNIVGRLNEQLTEIDTGITLLEVLKDDTFEDKPHLVMLPAPPQFESTIHQSHSANFIIMDTKHQLSRGIKAVTSVDSLPDANDFVTYIDGVTDLNNTELERGADGEISVKAQPGLLALNFLKFDMKISKLSRNPAFNKRIGELIRAREDAKKLSNSQSSFLIQAKKNIQTRIIEDLYK